MPFASQHNTMAASWIAGLFYAARPYTFNNLLTMAGARFGCNCKYLGLRRSWMFRTFLEHGDFIASLVSQRMLRRA
jgi:hypothetical protein